MKALNYLFSPQIFYLVYKYTTHHLDLLCFLIVSPKVYLIIRDLFPANTAKSLPFSDSGSHFKHSDDLLL